MAILDRLIAIAIHLSVVWVVYAVLIYSVSGVNYIKRFSEHSENLHSVQNAIELHPKSSEYHYQTQSARLDPNKISDSDRGCALAC